jgi:hypothetical protein
MTKHAKTELSADQVLVTVGTVCGLSAVGTVETQRALIGGSGNMIGFAARDAGLVDIEGDALEPRFTLRDGELKGQPLAPEEIERRWGAQLRANMGIRRLDLAASDQPSDLGAPLPHELERGGLRALTGTGFDQIRASSFRDAFGLFQDDPELGPSLQAQLFLYGALGALAALPRPLSEIVPQAHRFRVAAGCAFAGQEHVQNLARRMRLEGASGADKVDRLAYRLSASLNTHGPALINMLLSPAYSLSKVRKNPELLETLICPDSVLRNVPQAPLVLSGACTSALLALVDIAPQLLWAKYPGAHAPELVLWTAADAGLLPDARLLEGFGPAALMSTQKLAELNAGRSPEEARSSAAALAPFDRDASGTVIGHAGSGLLVTTLRFAVENFLDITSIIVGWGQSGESGGKGHFAGVGFGGENALLLALSMAELGHGYGAEDFQHLVAHATGTRVNSRTDLDTLQRARSAIAERFARGQLPRMSVGAPKALGDGHTMGEAGLRATAEAIYYVLGQQTVGVPSLRRVDPELSHLLDHFSIGAEAVAGNEDGGALTYAQGFGGYDAALALRSAHPDALRRYRFPQPQRLEAYLERRAELRERRERNERAARRAQGAALALAERHCWRSLG